MDASERTRLVISVKDLKSLIHVDMPCFVNSSSSVVQMLGGEALLNNALEKDSNNIQLRFPSENMCGSNQIGNKIENNGFLVKIRRRKSSSASNHDVSVTVVGCVKKSYVFNNPSDYQVHFFFFCCDI